MEEYVKALIVVRPRLGRLADRLDRLLDGLSICTNQDTERLLDAVMEIVEHKRQLVLLRDICYNMTACLKPREKLALEAKLHGDSEEDIACALEVSRGTVRNLYCSALEKCCRSLRRLRKYGQDVTECRGLLERAGISLGDSERAEASGLFR